MSKTSFRKGGEIQKRSVYHIQDYFCKVLTIAPLFGHKIKALNCTQNCQIGVEDDHHKWRPFPLEHIAKKKGSTRQSNEEPVHELDCSWISCILELNQRDNSRNVFKKSC